MLLACVCSALTSAGCTPVTRYRQTLFTWAAAPPPSFGAPLARAEVAGGGWVAGVAGSTPSLSQQLPEPHTPGLLVPAVSYGAQVRVGLVDAVELGASFERSEASWARRSALGVLDVRDGAAVMAGGVHATVGDAFPNGFGYGLTLDVAVLHLPWARYELLPAYADQLGSGVAGDGAELYRLRGVGAANPLQVRFTQGVSYRGDRLDLAAGLALAPQISNDGFSDTVEPVAELGAVSAIPCVDTGLRFGDLRLGAQLWYALFTRSATNGAYSGPGGRMTAEVRFGLRER